MVKRWFAGRTTILALVALAGIFVLVGTLANHSRVQADDPSSDRTLKPMGPPDQRTWPDDSLVRITGGGGGGTGKDTLTRDGGGGAVDGGAKPQDGVCSCPPTGR